MLKVDKKGDFAWLTINRPDVKNAFCLDFFTRIEELIWDIDDDNDIRVAITKAEGLVCPAPAIFVWLAKMPNFPSETKVAIVADMGTLQRLPSREP